jgi:NADP-dependent 3-hydroxy acid dehydrogenase YdfG
MYWFDLYKYWFDRNKITTGYPFKFVLRKYSSLKSTIIMKTILITGASAGIGKAAARRFASEGWNVIAAMCAPESESVLNKIENIQLARLDVQNKESITQAINLGIERFGNIDTILHDFSRGSLEINDQSSNNQIIRQFDQDVFGLRNLVNSILPYFNAEHLGTFINISAQDIKNTFPTGSLYYATRYAMAGISTILSQELHSKNIVVKTIESGSAETNLRSSLAYAENIKVTSYQENGDFDPENWKHHNNMNSDEADYTNAIFTAATDGKNQLLYRTGDNRNQSVSSTQIKTAETYIDHIEKQILPGIKVVNTDLKRTDFNYNDLCLN